MTIAIVDDIKEERVLLRTRLEKIFHQKDMGFHCCEYENGEAFLEASKDQDITVLFLDIYMDGANGIEIAKEFRKSNKDCLLIFTTTSSDHALEGFQVRAMHYLVKPYTEDELSSLTDEILSRIPTPEKTLPLKVNGSEFQVPFKTIVHADHFSHMIHIHTTAKKELVIRQSFSSFTAPLKEDSRFFVCNRGTIINMEHAVDFDGTMFLLDDGSKIAVSRELSKLARQHFMDYLFQRGGFLMRTIIFQALEFTVLIPGMLLAYLPVNSSLKQKPKKMIAWMLPLLVIISFLSGFVCNRFHLSTRMILLPLLFLTFILYQATLRISLWKSVSIYLAVCAVFLALTVSQEQRLLCLALILKNRLFLDSPYLLSYITFSVSFLLY